MEFCNTTAVTSSMVITTGAEHGYDDNLVLVGGIGVYEGVMRHYEERIL